MSSGRVRDGRLILDRQMVEVSRSDWTVELGPLRVARHRSVRRQLEYGPPPRRQAGGIGVGAIAAAGLAIAAPVYLVQAKMLVAPPAMVTQALPERAAASLPVPTPRVRQRRLPRPSSPSGEASFAASLQPVEPGAGMSADRAAAVAWRTGEPQDWSDGGAHGIVVPGAIERDGGFVCRTLARLTRQEGQPDAVDQSHRCSAIAPAIRAKED